MEKNYEKIVIVGAGMAGLTAAAYLAKAGYDVQILEKNGRSGGLLGTINNNGFQFDTGPRALINSGIVKPILKELGINWKYFENKISIGIEDKLFKVGSINDLQEYQRILTELYPENKEDVKKIISTVQELSEFTRVIYEFDNPYFGDQFSDKEYVIKKLLPWTFKFLKALRKFNQYKMPMEDFLHRLTGNQSLIDILTQHFFRNMPTYFVLGYFYVYLDYFYPKGGTGVFKDLLTEKVNQWGGQIKLNKRITRVIPMESKIVDAEGTAYPYDYLIWAADLKMFYRSLDPTGLDAHITRKLESEKESILASKGAESVFIMNLGVNRPPSYFKEHGGEHLFFTPSKQGLGETNRSQRLNLIENFSQASKSEVIEWLESYCDLTTYEISIPVLRDSSLAPEGQTGVMVSCLFDYQLIKNVETAGWYDEFKERLEKRIVSILSKTIFKDIEKDILFSFSATPLTINNISGNSEGAITGWSFEAEPPVIYKLTDVGKSVLTALPNVYKAGLWAYAPAGVPIAMLTAWHAYQKVLKQSKRKNRR
jgi:phytoene dehydrogenase-like protein